MAAHVRFEDVAEAVAQLQEAGVKPTRINVREQLGGRGSYTTISRHMAKLESDEKAAELQKPVPASVGELWQQLTNAARKDLEEERRQLDEERAQFEAERDRIRSQLARMEAHVHQVEETVAQRISDKDAELALARQAVSEAGEQAQKHREALEAVARALSDKIDLSRKEMAADVSSLTSEMSKLREENTALMQQAIGLQRQLDDRIESAAQAAEGTLQATLDTRVKLDEKFSALAALIQASVAPGAERQALLLDEMMNLRRQVEEAGRKDRQPYIGPMRVRRRR